MTYALGVDLGTTYSAAAVCRDGRVEPFTLGTTAPSIPSVVVLRADGEVLVGEAADRRSVSEPTRTAREFKRRLGDPTPLVLGGTPYGAESLMAHLLKEIVALVSEREGEPPRRAVLTHPANYGPYKAGLLQEAARLAGLDLEAVRYVTEPQAAAVAYAQAQRIESGDVVAVYDFGGGTFDAALVRKTESGFELVGTPEGMERLGGIDIDAAVLAHVNDTLDGMLSDLDTSDEITRAALARLRDECRKAKEALSTDTDTSIPVSLPGLQTEVRLTREELEAMIRPRLLETIEALQRAVASAGVSMEDVARILLVGGTSRMPLVGQLVREMSGRPVALDAHPKLAIACGAALLGASEDDDAVAAAPLAASAAASAAAPAVGAAPAGLAAAAAVGGVAFAGTGGAAAVARGLGGTPAAAAEQGAAGSAFAHAPAAASGVHAASPPTTPAASPPTTPAASPPTTPAASPPATPAASPPATPAASPPATPAASPPTTPVRPTPSPPSPPSSAAETVVSAPRRILPLVAGGAAGIAAGVIAIVVVVSGGGDDPARTTEVAATTPVVTSAPAASTTSLVAGARADESGVIDTFAGSGEQGTAGEGGPAVDAAMDRPESVAIDSKGDVYIADNNTQRILKVSGGVLTVLYRGGTLDGESNTYGVAVAPDDSVWFSNGRGVFKLAGTTATLVLSDQLTGAPYGLAFDKSGNLYVAEAGGNQVAKYDTSGILTFIAGTGEASPQAGGVGDGGPASAALLGRPGHVAVDSRGNVYIAEVSTERIRKVATDGTISTFAGGGSVPISTIKDGTPGADIEFNTIDAVAVDWEGKVYVADHQGQVILRFGADGKSEHVAGLSTGTPGDGHPARSTKLDSPYAMTFGRDGTLYFVDNVRVRRLAGVAREA